MKKYLVTAFLGMSLTVPAVSIAEEVPEDFQSQLSYSIGYEMGSYLKTLDTEVKSEILFDAAQAAFAGEKPALSEEKMMEVKQQFAQKKQLEEIARIEKMKEENLAAGKAFLEENKKKEGVVVTDSGLQYQIIKQGEGDKAKPGDIVTVTYSGTLVDGTVFDSTEKHGGKPATFEVDKVIPGWTEAMQLMNPGTKMHLVIPPELAYGEQGASPVIEPNSVLIFDVELLAIKAPEEKQEVQPASVSVADEAKAAAKKVEAAAEKVEAAIEKSADK